MKRAASEKLRTLRVWGRHLASHDKRIACRCEAQAGRFRKGQRVGGCGRPRCWLCHYDKLGRLTTLRERRATWKFHEGMSERECSIPLDIATRLAGSPATSAFGNRQVRHPDFQIGIEFFTETGKWRCTDVGTRVIVAISWSLGNGRLARGSGRQAH